MKFYSYDYVLSQISQDNRMLAIFMVVLMIFTVYIAYKGYKNQRESKYRELVIILVLMMLIFVLSFISKFQANEVSDNQYRTSLHFIEVVSEDLQVDKRAVYVNTSAATDGAIVYVDGAFYRAISGNDQDMYLLEKMELYDAKVELVEVEK